VAHPVVVTTANAATNIKLKSNLVMIENPFSKGWKQKTGNGLALKRISPECAEQQRSTNSRDFAQSCKWK
jgi:hypothetical protein|tara:strand:- start:51816 stop:52025 length:210 start_codon:yes stop_codon:yes gene_type:complete